MAFGLLGHVIAVLQKDEFWDRRNQLNLVSLSSFKKRRTDMVSGVFIKEDKNFILALWGNFIIYLIEEFNGYEAS